MLNIQNSTKQKIFSVTLEVFLILVAVLLGMIVNEMRIAHNERQRTKKILHYMITEINDNSKSVSSMIPYHKTMRDSLGKITQTLLVKKNQIFTHEDLFKAMPKGFRVPLIETTGWVLLNNSDAINNLDLELSIELSKIYHLQQFLQGKLEKIGENIYISSNINLNETNSLILAFGFLVDDILIQEERLIESYSNVIEKLKKEAK